MSQQQDLWWEVTAFVPVFPNGSLQLRSDLSNITTFARAREKKVKHPILGCEGCASLVHCLGQAFHRGADIVKRGQEGSKPAAWHPLDCLLWPRKEQWLQELFKYKRASPGKISSMSLISVLPQVGVFFFASASPWGFKRPPSDFHGEWRRVNSNSLPSFRAGKSKL